jgi:hypothetical protein
VPANTLYNGRVPHGTLHLIDFHRLVHSPLLGWRWRVKDLAELLFSSEIAGVNDRDRLRFFQRYRGRRRRSLGMRWLARWVRWKARRYLAHNRRVQCRKQLQPGQKPTLPLALPSEGRTP